MDSSTAMAPATEMAATTCGISLSARVVGTPRATSAGWRVALMAGNGHRYNQIKFPPRMGPPTCSSPV